MVFERGDPLRRVLRRARGLDHPFMKLPRRAGQRRVLASLVGLLLLGGLALLHRLCVTGVDRVDLLPEQPTGCMRVVTGP